MSGIVSCVCWVGKGASKQIPDKVQLTKEEMASLIQKTRKSTPRTEESDVEESDSPNASGAEEDEEDVDKLYNLQHYDSEEEGEEDESKAGSIAGLSGLAYYVSNEDDPYVTLKDIGSSDDEEKEDFRIQPTDNLLLVGRADEEISTVEVHVYSEEDDHAYCHHEILLGEYPLAMEWLDFDPGQPEEKGNFVAIGTMSPVIEVWDLDLVDGLEPVCSLGSPPKKRKKEKKKKKKKGKVKSCAAAAATAGEADSEEIHDDAVLGLVWNKSVRSLLASASADHTARVWDLLELKCVLTLPHPDKVQTVQWHCYEPQLLATGCYDGVVRLYNCETQTLLRQWKLGGEIEKVLWNHFQPNFLLASTEDSHVFCLNKDSDSPVFTIHAHNQAITDISLSFQVPGLLVTCSSDDSIKFWDIYTKSPVFLHSKNMHMGAILCAQFCVDSPYTLVVGGQKNGFSLINVLRYPSLNEKCKERGLLVPVNTATDGCDQLEESSCMQGGGAAEEEGEVAMEVEPSSSSSDQLQSSSLVAESSSSQKHKKSRKKKRKK